MAVLLDAASTASNTANAATTVSLTTLTVGSGINRALICVLGMQTGFTGMTVSWDPIGANQPLTLIGSIAGSAGTTSLIFGLVNPTSGNKTLTATWTTAVSAVIDAIAFTNVIQTGGTTSFPNFNSATSTGTAATVAITTDVNSYVVGTAATGGFNVSSVDHTTLHVNNANMGWGSNYSVGSGTSVTLGATLSGSSTGWSMVGTSLAPDDVLGAQIWI